jgi:hypothetical protein
MGLKAGFHSVARTKENSRTEARFEYQVKPRRVACGLLVHLRLVDDGTASMEQEAWRVMDELKAQFMRRF